VAGDEVGAGIFDGEGLGVEAGGGVTVLGRERVTASRRRAGYGRSL
jgi:hypothetical protein